MINATLSVGFGAGLTTVVGGRSRGQEKTQTRHLNRLGQLSEFEQKSSAASQTHRPAQCAKQNTGGSTISGGHQGAGVRQRRGAVERCLLTSPVQPP